VKPVGYTSNQAVPHVLIHLKAEARARRFDDAAERGHEPSHEPEQREYR
jgi:hypothetical protein